MRPAAVEAPSLEDLGVARYPANTGAAPRSFAWWILPDRPPSYRVGYALDLAEQRSVQQAFSAWAKSMGHSSRSARSFAWSPPPGCVGDMRCVYENVIARSERDLAPLVALLTAHRDAGKASSEDLVVLVISFVQAIPYSVPSDEPFEVLPPALVLARGKGDCDSKVVLAHALLRQIGVDSIVLSSHAHAHAMLGIAVPTVGKKIRYQGRDYAFTEMTSPNALPGMVSPTFMHPNDWRVVPVRVAKKPAPGAK